MAKEAVLVGVGIVVAAAAQLPAVAQRAERPVPEPLDGLAHIAMAGVDLDIVGEAALHGEEHPRGRRPPAEGGVRAQRKGSSGEAQAEGAYQAPGA